MAARPTTPTFASADMLAPSIRKVVLYEPFFSVDPSYPRTVDRLKSDIMSITRRNRTYESHGFGRCERRHVGLCHGKRYLR